MVFLWASILALALALAGCGYLIAAALMVGRFVRRAGTHKAAAFPGVTLLKPLHGAEPGLYENLLSFCRQNYEGALQVVFGVQDANDAAIGVVEQVRKLLPQHDIDLVIDATTHGSNHKVSNLINMATRIRHEVVVLADSDMRVRPDYLSRVVAALQTPGVGAVTCVYRGVAVDGFWSRLFALAIDAQFLPNVLLGLGLGVARPCFGSTIAIRHETLAGIGGFAVAADALADDYAIGSAVRAHGHEVAIPPFVIAHVCGPMTVVQIWEHELRWARTIRTIDPAGYAGLVLSYPLPWALLAVLLGAISGTWWAGLALAVIAAMGRIALLWHLGRTLGFTPHSCWLVPLRELFSCAVFVASFFSRDVNWKNRRFRVQANGTLVPDEDSRTS